MNALLLTLSLAAGQSEDSARASYRQGIDERDDSKAARPHFAESAAEYRELWERGNRSPDLALARARAEFLAGNLPGAIAAAHAGLRIAPHHAGLQRDLETYRDAVVPGTAVQADESLRQPRLDGVRTRVGPWDLFAIATVATILLGLAAIRRFSRGGTWTLPLALLGTLGMLLCGGLAGKRALEEQNDLAEPIAILSEDETLRKGNGESHAARIEVPLPRGTEVREIGRRGGWIQVRVAGGAIGWLPEPALLAIP